MKKLFQNDIYHAVNVRLLPKYITPKNIAKTEQHSKKNIIFAIACCCIYLSLWQNVAKE